MTFPSAKLLKNTRCYTTVNSEKVCSKFSHSIERKKSTIVFTPEDEKIY